MNKLRFKTALMASLAAIIITASCSNEPVITFRSLLKEMADPESITHFPDHRYRLVQFSSYDRQSIHPDAEYPPRQRRVVCEQRLYSIRKGRIQ